jgi:hypothetical protein
MVAVLADLWRVALMQDYPDRISALQAVGLA